MNLVISLRSEILKTKRTAAFYFTLAGAAVVPLIFLINALTYGLPNEEKSSRDPINAIFNLASEMTGIGILPLFVVLICALLPQAEFKNNTWKQVFASPQTKAQIFIAKFVNVHLLILLFFVANYLFMWIVITAIHFIIPGLHILQQPFNGYTVWESISRSYVSVLSICAIQFWMGLRFKNFIVPIAIGLVLWLTGTVMALEHQSSWSPYFPYSFQACSFSSVFKPQLNQVLWTSAGYAVVILLAGFIDFKRRRMV